MHLQNGLTRIFFFTIDLVRVDKLFSYIKLIEKIMLSVVFPCVILNFYMFLDFYLF